MRTGPIRFWHDDRVVEVHDLPSTTTVLSWLRDHARRPGTKEGCNVGDCGACTVVLGEPRTTETGTQLNLVTVNSCLTYLPMLHGRALITVEDLARMNGGSLHPAQASMAEGQGSQCGYCTPGIVMSLWNLWQEQKSVGRPHTRQQLADGLAGNLCRCTGYRSILDAAERMQGMEGAVFEPGPALDALAATDSSGGFAYLASGTAFWAPSTIEELVETVVAHPFARVVAGMSDVGLHVNESLADLPELIWTARVDELRVIDRTQTHLVIGAAAPLEDAWAALVAHAPALEQMWLRFASPSIRHTATMGGNVVNGSPIGDSAPVLLALDAELVVVGPEGTRRVPLDQFYLGYQANDLRPGEVVARIEIPLSAFSRDLRAYKVSRRFDSDISAVSAACALAVVDDRVVDVRLAFGGLAPVVHRAEQAEAALVGRQWNDSAMRAAQEALVADFSPITDHRATAEYRMQVARGLLERLYRQTSGLVAAESDVWTRP